jgi:DNA-binding transcriptional regulator/RsmH inhibitor MraZ
MVTQNLLGYAGIERDVVIVGRAGQAEIWDAEEFNRFELENLTPEKLLASLEAIGL